MNKNLNIVRNIYRNINKTDIKVLGNGHIYCECHQEFPSILNVFVLDNEFNNCKKTINYHLKKELSCRFDFNKLNEFEKISKESVIYEIDEIKLKKLIPLIKSNKIVKINFFNTKVKKNL